MTKKSFILPVFFALPLFAADRTWVLKQSALTSHVSHPLHQTDGVSHAARGKGICQEGQCEFLIAVAVKTFDSGDSNRDLHMIQVTRGAEFPLVTVRTRVPESASTSSTIKADLEIQFAGQRAHYKGVPFTVTAEGIESTLRAPFRPRSPIARSSRPRCSPLPVKNEIPVKVDMTWSPQ